MIIFGWGFQTIKNFGPTFKNLCGHCNNEEYWVLTRVMTWFTLFFIPIFPYQIKYHLTCPICQYGLKLESEQINKMRPLAEANQLLIDGKINDDEYQAKIGYLKSDTSDPVSSEVELVKTLTTNDANLIYCSGCGKQITKKLKYCGNCGVQIEHKK